MQPHDCFNYDAHFNSCMIYWHLRHCAESCPQKKLRPSTVTEGGDVVGRENGADEIGTPSVETQLGDTEDRTINENGGTTETAEAPSLGRGKETPIGLDAF